MGVKNDFCVYVIFENLAIKSYLHLLAGLKSVLYSVLDRSIFAGFSTDPDLGVVEVLSMSAL